MAQETKQLLQSLLKVYNIPSTGIGIQENILQRVSDKSSGRTNQFEVQARLNGLVEKSWILNNGALGDALQKRLDELPKISNQWTPDALSFLLALSDRPVHKTRVEDLASLSPDLPTPPLTWEAIIGEDPYEDLTAVWRDVDFAADGSDEDGDDLSRLSGKLDDDDVVDVPQTDKNEIELESLILEVDNEDLNEVSLAQAWRADVLRSTEHRSQENEDAYEILEVNAIREVIFMLLGLPTSIFEVTGNGNLSLRRNVKLHHTSSKSVTHVTHLFLVLGQKLSTIREWIKEDVHLPLEQAFQSALETRVHSFQSTMHDLQKVLLDQSSIVVVSINNVDNGIGKSSRLLLQLHEMLVRVKAVAEEQRPFRILEVLHNQTCLNQKIGDDEGYEYMAQVFFQCFQIYLRPIQVWMETGEADSHNPIMFIEKTIGVVAPHLLWQDQYRLVQSANGTLKAPQFLHVAGRRIFTAGKSVHFLKRLGIEDSMQGKEQHGDSLMTYEAVCSNVDPRNFIPFPELFDAAMTGWIASKQSSSSLLLRQELQSPCGLKRVLMALDQIYLYSNGALSNNAVGPLFEKIERGNHLWNDSFSTTESFRDVFAAVDCIDVDRLSIRPSASKNASETRGKSMSILEKLHVSYMLPWPIANIIKSPSMTTYQRIFTFLTQVERARYLLHRNKLPRNGSKRLYSIHTHLLWFANIFLSHLKTLVIAVNKKTLDQDMTEAEDVDAMIAVHQAYIARLEDQCFLAKKHDSLRRAVVSILDLAVLFSDFQTPLDSRRHRSRRSASFSSDGEDEDVDESHQAVKLDKDAESQSAERLLSIHKTYSQLLAIITTSVESLRKTDGGPIWTVLASNLAFGAVT